MTSYPLHDRAVVGVLERRGPTRGGCVIAADATKENPTAGGIAAAGLAGREDIGPLVPFHAKAGGNRSSGPWFGAEVSIDGETLIMVKGSDIKGVVAAA